MLKGVGAVSWAWLAPTTPSSPHCPHHSHHQTLIVHAGSAQCQDLLQEVAEKLEPVHRKKKDRTALGLALYALSSCFLATMLMFAKKLGKPFCPSTHRPGTGIAQKAGAESWPCCFSGPSCWLGDGCRM